MHDIKTYNISIWYSAPYLLLQRFDEFVKNPVQFWIGITSQLEKDAIALFRIHLVTLEIFLLYLITRTTLSIYL